MNISLRAVAPIFTGMAAIAAVAVACTSQIACAKEIGSYITAWSAETKFRLKQFDESKLAGKFTFLNYAFENVYRMPDGSFQCASGADVDNHSDGTGMMASLDYVHHFGADESVDGSADQAGQALAGNFNQIRELKSRNPNLKVMVALGGGEWSRWFSAGAATPALRRKLAASCINLYIKGNLPMFNGHGGKGAAAGLFNGVDVDWEHPGLHGAAYNTVSRHDKKNFTLLLAEFRHQLDTFGRSVGRHYVLTAAINSTPRNMAQTEPSKYVKSLDWINLMTYDFHGAWSKQGPTNFQSNLYSDSADPDSAKLSVDSNVGRFIAAGVPRGKIVVGIPFYARGWSGVADVNHGLYQKAEGPAKGFEEGAERYGDISTKSLTKFIHPTTRQLWTFDQGTFWTFDDPSVIAEKARYIAEKNLGGIMSWSLDQDDVQFSLSGAMVKLQ